MPLYLREDCRADLATIAPEIAQALSATAGDSSGVRQIRSGGWLRRTLRWPHWERGPLARMRAGRPRSQASARALYHALAQANGVVFRQAAHRRTMRLTAAGGFYFAKLHGGVGWSEIAKNLIVGKRPVLGAHNEFAACRRLAAHGVHAPLVAAFGACGRNPARRRSFLVCSALSGMASLEELTARGDFTPLLRHRLIAASGDLLRAMHGAGVHHRDCYLAHIFADSRQWAEGRVVLAIIDLHRAWVRQRLPDRWRRRDLAALLVSAAPLRLTTRELLRFAAAYAGDRATWQRDRRFWSGVLRSAERLRRRSARRGRPAAGLAAAAIGDTVASVTDFHALREPPALPFRFDVDLRSGPARAVCTKLLCWRARREFTALATVNGDERLLDVFFGLGRAHRYRRAERVARRLAAAGASAGAVETGRCNGAHLLLYPPLTGRRPEAGDLPMLVSALARMHEQALRLRNPGAAFHLHCGEARIAPWEVCPLRRPRRPAIERDLGTLFDLLGGSSAVAEGLRLYAKARRWTEGRLDAGHVSDHMAHFGGCRTRP